LKALVQAIRKIEKRTWVEKVTDDTNPWLSARNLLREGQYEDAAQCYLKDASEQKEKNILRTALSISAAARCLAQIDKAQESSQLFLEASKLYKSAIESENRDESFLNWISERISYCQSRAAYLGNHSSTTSE